MGDLFLSDIKIGEECFFVSFSKSAELNIKRRMLELGFFVGVKIKVAQESFLKNVLLIELNGYTLSLRKNIAENIIVARSLK